MSNAGGVMSWELSQDATGPYSLITTIDQATSSVPYGPISGLAHKCMDVRSGQSANGTPIQLWSCNGTSAQSWTVDRTNNAAPSAPLANASTSRPRRPPTASRCSSTTATGPARSWRSLADGSLWNANSGKCIGAWGWGTADGTRLVQWDCTGDTNQLWQVPGHPVPVKSGWVIGLAGKCLDVQASRTANGTPVQIYGCNGSPAQTWSLDAGSLRALGKCLDVPNSSGANGTRLQLWDCNGSTSQVWQPFWDGSVRNISSGKCLDVPNSNAADGNRVQIFDCNGTAAQHWQVPS